MAICVKCVYHEIYVTGEEKDVACKNPDLPITDFIYGIRWCDNLNPKGDCKGFKPQAKPDSIYESKTDEELARTTDAHTD